VHQNWKGIGRHSTVGLEFALSVILGLFGGRWLDQELGTDGWLTFIGLGFGIAAGYRSVWRALDRANRDADREEREQRDERTKFHDDGKD
jgi:ATP synthase protein I